jgi:hypothetical protein
MMVADKIVPVEVDMHQELIHQLQSAEQRLAPQLKALREASGALKKALKLASEERPDALPMHKALLKLEHVAERLDDGQLRAATEAFRAETERALEALSFEFAKDLKESFEARGIVVAGRPPTLVVEALVLNIDIAARKAQWFYGKEALTRPLPLSLGAILKAFEQQKRELLERDSDPEAFLAELYGTWANELASRSRQPRGGRLNLVETYSKMTLNRQSARFWNAPSRSTFKDYPRPHFVRDLALAQAAPTVTVDGKRYRLLLGVATKSQAEQASRSVWVPSGPLEGSYYSDLTFEAVAG